MNAVLELQSPVDIARAKRDATQAKRDALDARKRAYQQEVEEREVARRRHEVADRNAIIDGKPRPKLKLPASDAEAALPVVDGELLKVEQQLAEDNGEVRRAQVQHIQQEYRQTLEACPAPQMVEWWRRVVGLRSLLDQAGVKGEPLPPVLLDAFCIPAVGRLRPICEHHSMHFLASHELAPEGAVLRLTLAARAEIEADVGKLPW